MQRRLFIIYIIVTVVFLFGFTNYNTVEKPPSSFINSIEEDISGDGIREYLKLQGELIAEDSRFYQNVWLDILNSFGQEWTISLKGGYHPELMLYDINHNKVNDIIYQVALDEEKEHFATQIYTLTNHKIEQITLPTNNQIKGKYIDNYKIALTFHPNDKPLYFPINKNNEKLIETNMYDDNGKLQQDISLIIDPIKKYKPILISRSKGYGLTSVQSVRNKNNNNIIGTIETLWYFNNGNWIILKNEWHSAQ